MSFRATSRVDDDVVTLHRIPRDAAEPVEIPAVRRHDPLLITKLLPPPARAGQVPRPDLLARLDEGIAGKITLVSAPAGYGKSTLLAEWAAVCEPPVAWVALDEEDSDPARFWAYVIAALQALSPEVLARTPEVSNELRETRIEPAVAALINAIACLAGRMILILDNYHLVDADAVHRGVAFLVDHLPPQLHLVVAGRADPPLPISRWRAQGALTELRSTDLRFSAREAGALMTGVMRRDLAHADIEALSARTEGWAAGLQLAALAMREREQIAPFVAAFSGSHRSVVDYLVDEVFERLSTDDQAFLVETSFLDRLSGPLCDAVTGRNDGEDKLACLERANLFLVALDDERRWYRYHQLFADVLYGRLRTSRLDDIARLHACAANWFAGQGFADEAVHHALAAGEWPLVADLIRQVGPLMLTRGEFATLLAWIRQTPVSFVESSSSLCRIRAWASVFTGSLADAEDALSHAARSRTPLPDYEAGEIAAIQACIARLRGNIQASLDLSFTALAGVAGHDALLHGVVLVNHAAGLGTIGEFDDAYVALDEADRLALDAGEHLALIALSHRARLLVIQGKLRSAIGFYQAALQVGIADRGPSFPAASYASIGIGAIWYEWNRLDAAARALMDGITLCKGGRLDLEIVGYLTLARVKRAMGSVETARTLVRDARALAGRYGVPHMLEMVDAFDAWLALVEGDLDAAERWAESRGGAGVLPRTYRAEEAQLVLARIAIARGRPAEALPILARLEKTTGNSGRAGHLVEALAIECIALDAAGYHSRALAKLSRLLDLAEPQGYIRTFVDEGPAFAGLLAALHQDETLPPSIAAYVEMLLEANGRETARRRVRRNAAPVPDANPDALTPRELEVLRKLTAGLSNSEIADTLFVSIGTVKRHTNSIYSKLGVGNRGRAVARARELQLIAE